MAVSIIGDFNALKVMIERDGDAAYRASLITMDEKANEIVEEGRKNAPVDKHNLERAINRYPKKDSGETRKIRDPATGRYLKYRVEIGVDKTIADKETGESVNIEQYAAIMHESDRAGHGNVEENKRKRMEGGDPGKKYLERAFDKVDPTVVPTMINKVREAI